MKEHNMVANEPIITKDLITPGVWPAPTYRKAEEWAEKAKQHGARRAEVVRVGPQEQPAADIWPRR